MLVNKKIIIDPSLEGKPFQVMMAWEKPYMEHLIKKLKPKGDVLEIGFGLGYSASAIQKYNITSHTTYTLEWSHIRFLFSKSKRENITTSI